MSTPAVPDAFSPIDPRSGLIVRVAEQLVPLFRGPTIDLPLARKMAFSAIGAYEPESRADFVNAARTIAFSMAALALLSQAATEDLTLTEKMRVLSRANVLNGSADRSERMMMQRRRYQHANPPAELPDWLDPGPEPVEADTALDEAELEAAVAEAVSAHLAQFNAAKPETVPQTPTPESHATIDPVEPDAAIRYSSPRMDSGRRESAPHRDGVSGNSAIPRAVRETGAQSSA
jgi:hypothetical protein